MTTAKIVFSSTETAPLYCKYQDQVNPQPAYVTLDLDTGEIDADYSSEIGNGMPASVWHGTVRRYRVNNQLSADQVNDLLEELLPVFQRVLDGAETVWDGSNWVGSLSDDAYDAERELEDLGSNVECNVITDLADWLSGGGRDCWMPAQDADIEKFIAEFDLDGYVALESVRETLMTMWANELYSGDPIPQNVAQYLLKTGHCDGSAWIEELTAYSEGRQPE